MADHVRTCYGGRVGKSMEGVELSPAQRSLAASLRASTLSLLLPSFNMALRRGLQTTMCCTCGCSRSYSQSTQVPCSSRKP